MPARLCRRSPTCSDRPSSSEREATAVPEALERDPRSPAIADGVRGRRPIEDLLAVCLAPVEGSVDGSLGLGSPGLAAHPGRRGGGLALDPKQAAGVRQRMSREREIGLESLRHTSSACQATTLAGAGRDPSLPRPMFPNRQRTRSERRVGLLGATAGDRVVARWSVTNVHDVRNFAGLGSSAVRASALEAVDSGLMSGFCIGLSLAG